MDSERLAQVADLMDSFTREENMKYSEKNKFLDEQLSNTYHQLMVTGNELSTLNEQFDNLHDAFEGCQRFLNLSQQENAQLRTDYDNERIRRQDVWNQFKRYKAEHKRCLQRTKDYHDRLQLRMLQAWSEKELELRERIRRLEEQLLDCTCQEQSETESETEVIDLTGVATE